MKFWLAAGAINGLLGVALGAFAAHGLKQKLEPRLFDIWEVGVRYHMYHALALLAVAFFADRLPSSPLNWAGYAFLFGIILFSGSLYAYALTNHKSLVFITPVGGGAFLVGWLILALAALRMR